MYPNKTEFEDRLLNGRLESILSDLLSNGLPFCFFQRPELYGQMMDRVTQGLGVREADLCVVGSAKIGFSLSPYKFGDPFSNRSDIDIVVVSSVLFDECWLDILTNRRTPWRLLREKTRDRLTAHRNDNYVYRGWIYPDSIAEALNIGQEWLNTFNGLSTIPDLAARPVNTRLYRTWEHARAYHRRSLRQVRNKILENREG